MSISKQQYDELLKALKMLDGPDVLEEARKKDPLIKEHLSGMLLQNWLPFGFGRKFLMVSFLLAGVYGIFSHNFLVIALLIIPVFSPRCCAEIAGLLGRLNGNRQR